MDVKASEHEGRPGRGGGAEGEGGGVEGVWGFNEEEEGVMVAMLTV